VSILIIVVVFICFGGKDSANRAKYKINFDLFLFALPRYANSDLWFRDAAYLRGEASEIRFYSDIARVLGEKHCLFDWRAELLLGDPVFYALAGALLMPEGQVPGRPAENKTAELIIKMSRRIFELCSKSLMLATPTSFTTRPSKQA